LQIHAFAVSPCIYNTGTNPEAVKVSGDGNHQIRSKNHQDPTAQVGTDRASHRSDGQHVARATRHEARREEGKSPLFAMVRGVARLSPTGSIWPQALADRSGIRRAARTSAAAMAAYHDSRLTPCRHARSRRGLLDGKQVLPKHPCLQMHAPCLPTWSRSGLYEVIKLRRPADRSDLSRQAPAARRAAHRASTAAASCSALRDRTSCGDICWAVGAEGKISEGRPREEEPGETHEMSMARSRGKSEPCSTMSVPAWTTMIGAL
jgi:hypothetical protein